MQGFLCLILFIGQYLVSSNFTLYPSGSLPLFSGPQVLLKKNLKVKSFIILQREGAWVQFNPETLKCWVTLPNMMRSP